MTEHDGSTSPGTGTAEIPVGRPGTPTPGPPAPAAAQPVEPSQPTVPGSAAPEGELVPGMQPTTPVTVRPRPRMPRRGPLTVMGPWAPVAGGLLGLLLGVVVVLFLAGSA